ncbi:EpsG family protein [Fusobacterium sp. SYSU M8D902]|uniref:EpsG family protein n=1 Tax=Fusobacterium sp. SYSU M8D902 TaxID=3159562 RepID=UPI0032E3D785
MQKGLLVSSVYIIISIISIFLIKRDEKKFDEKKSIVKISYPTILLISILFTIFNIYSTQISSKYGSDRLNYIYEFNYLRDTTSVALNTLIKIIRIMNGDVYTLFYFTTFICVFLFLIGYRISKNMNSKIYILMLTNEWILFTIITLKQAYACAIASLFFIIMLEYKRKQRMILGIICIILATLFHISSIILLPFFILFQKKRLNKNIIVIILFLIIIIILKIETFVFILEKILEIISINYANKIRNYFSDFKKIELSATFLKYIPIYYITLLGVLKRKKYLKVFKNYDKYLSISIICSTLLIFSIKIYWFTRFVGIFYVPVFIFYYYINTNFKSRTIQNINNIIVYGGTLVILLRKIILIFVNYGFF